PAASRQPPAASRLKNYDQNRGFVKPPAKQIAKKTIIFLKKKPPWGEVFLAGINLCDKRRASPVFLINKQVQGEKR
ncbi:MAG: hypothetical protein FWG66_14155, partial [Spirochaetes bacterium]|nr:hypothetical protein [Spirochaetota bacterium]